MSRHSRYLAGAACFAALTITACASDGYGPGYGAPEVDQVVLFDGANYSGTSVGINETVTGLVPYRFNDAASSIEINYGAWEVCEDSNFRGRCEVLTSSSPDLRGLRLNDNISSLRPVGNSGGYPPGNGGGYASLTFFSNTGLRGEALTVDRDEPNFARAGFNDRARSVDVRGGTWQVCVDGDFRGRCETIDRPVSDLRDIGLSGNISSARRLPDPRGY